MLRLAPFLFGVMALAWVGPARAQPPSATAPADPLPPELQAELDALQRGLWVPSGTLRGSIGWRDNVLLSSFAPLSRPFGRGEVEAMLVRPMRQHWEFLSFLNGDVLRYFSPPVETGGEQQWSLLTEGRWQPLDPLRISLKATGYLRDMVIDLSESEAEADRVIAPTRVRGAYLTLAPRLALSHGWFFEPAVQVKRTDYRDYPGDYKEARGGGHLEWRGAGWLALSAGWFESNRDYRERTQYASGRPIPNTRLNFRQRDAELKARIEWKAAGDWSTTITAGRMENRDGSPSRYFDYDQKRGRLTVDWRHGKWQVELDGEAKHQVFLAQTAEGGGISPPARIADDAEATLRIERELNPRWTLFCEQHWERSRSNLIGYSYRSNTALAGVQRNF